MSDECVGHSFTTRSKIDAMNGQQITKRGPTLESAGKWGTVVTLSMMLLMAFSSAADGEADDADVLRAAALNP
jgi:hypothetical protein